MSWHSRTVLVQDKEHVCFSFSVPVVMVTLFVKHNDGIGSNAFMTFLIKTTV